MPHTKGSSEKINGCTTAKNIFGDPTDYEQYTSGNMVHKECRKTFFLDLLSLDAVYALSDLLVWMTASASCAGILPWPVVFVVLLRIPVTSSLPQEANFSGALAFGRRSLQ